MLLRALEAILSQVLLVLWDVNEAIDLAKALEEVVETVTEMPWKTLCRSGKLSERVTVSNLRKATPKLTLHRLIFMFYLACRQNDFWISNLNLLTSIAKEADFSIFIIK